MMHTQPGHARTRTVTGPTQADAHISLAQFIRRGVESHWQTATVTWLQLSLFIEYVPLGAFARLLRASFLHGEARSAKVLRIVTRADLVRYSHHTSLVHRSHVNSPSNSSASGTCSLSCCPCLSNTAYVLHISVVPSFLRTAAQASADLGNLSLVNDNFRFGVLAHDA
jgi:hypothetical protein